MSTTDLAILISFSGQGGVERMLLNLLPEFLKYNLKIDLLTIKTQSAHLSDIPQGIQVIPLSQKTTLATIPRLTTYLKQNKPKALLAIKDRAGQAAIWAKKLAQVDTKIIIRIGTTLSAALADKPTWLRELRYLPMRFNYRFAYGIIAVSQGVKDDLLTILTSYPEEKIRVIHNPVITPSLYTQAKQSNTHPWIIHKNHPILLAAGRLTQQKDFITLIQAIALVKPKVKLIILGEGRQRALLEKTIHSLGLEQQIALPGFVNNPYYYMQYADIFVLSSLWEGSPNVLTEAMALGISVIATDCPSGPKEILQQGKYGKLVPLKSPIALAQAIEATLKAPLPSDFIQQAVSSYQSHISAKHYLDYLGLINE